MESKHEDEKSDRKNKISGKRSEPENAKKEQDNNFLGKYFDNS